jgi:polysaccharide export outer membrane protein
MTLLENGRRLVLCALLMMTAACSVLTIGELPDQDAPSVTENPSVNYLLDPGNKVRVTVFNEPNLSGEFILDPVGNLALPLVGNVPAAGITAKTLGSRIEDMLKRANLMQDPKVSVEVQTFRPFYVLGEVRSAGEFPYVSGMTVLSAIARAGGYDYRAREDSVVLVRTVQGKQTYYRASERTPILPGDIIKVLQRRI